MQMKSAAERLCRFSLHISGVISRNPSHSKLEMTELLPSTGSNVDVSSLDTQVMAIPSYRELDTSMMT